MKNTELEQLINEKLNSAASCMSQPIRVVMAVSR
jgi:hypothetical protein